MDFLSIPANSFFSSLPSSSCAACFLLCGVLPFLDKVTHLGHVLHYDLNDTPDINYTQVTGHGSEGQLPFACFPGVGPLIMTHLFQVYCLSLYGFCLWSLSSPALHNNEVAFTR